MEIIGVIIAGIIIGLLGKFVAPGDKDNIPIWLTILCGFGFMAIKYVEDKGKWEINKPLPHPWIISFKGTRFLLKPSPFKHTGIFAEQAANWEWMASALQGKKNRKIVNLFGYTGAATMVLTAGLVVACATTAATRGASGRPAASTNSVPTMSPGPRTSDRKSVV